jgi:gas vesicle protein
MGYEYDRFEREDRGGASFLMGLLAGTVLGAGLGMLFAPKAGSELRNQITDQAGRLQRSATDAYSQASQTVNKAIDRGKDAYEKAREAVSRGSEDARRYAGSISTPGSGETPGTPGGVPPSTGRSS